MAQAPPRGPGARQEAADEQIGEQLFDEESRDEQLVEVEVDERVDESGVQAGVVERRVRRGRVTRPPNRVVKEQMDKQQLVETVDVEHDDEYAPHHARRELHVVVERYVERLAVLCAQEVIALEVLLDLVEAWPARQAQRLQRLR